MINFFVAKFSYPESYITKNLYLQREMFKLWASGTPFSYTKLLFFKCIQLGLSLKTKIL